MHLQIFTGWIGLVEEAGINMNIIGENVILRAIELSDKEILLRIINDGETEYLLGGWSFPVSELEQEAWIESLESNINILRCMIDDKQGKRTVGTVILSDIDYKNGTAEIQIKLLGDFQGKGYGTDTIRTMVNYCFNELRLHCIYARINEDNTSSQKMVERVGFNREGVLRDRVFKEGKYLDVITYSILNEENNGDRW